MFSDVELVFNVAELKFNVVEHKFSGANLGLWPKLHEIYAICGDSCTDLMQKQ
jgi:hypothetical protein